MLPISLFDQYHILNIDIATIILLYIIYIIMSIRAVITTAWTKKFLHLIKLFLTCFISHYKYLLNRYI